MITLRERYGGARLLELAAEKDRGFTPETFLVALRALGRLQPADWTDAGISNDQVRAIDAAVKEWCNELEG